MLACLTSSQLAEWMAYHAVEPFGQFRAEARNGLLISAMANMKRDEKKRPQPFKVQDFMLFSDEQDQQQKAESASQIAARMKQELFRIR